jgi:hypothetical protein
VSERRASVTDLSATLPTSKLGKRSLRKVQEFALAQLNSTTNYLLKILRRNKKFHPLTQITE